MSREHQQAKKRLRAAVVALFGDTVGCTDHGCIYGHPGGMGTNGGCGCSKTRDLTEMRHHAQRMHRVALYLAASKDIP